MATAGGAIGDVPFLHVGAPAEQPLTADLLFAHRISWRTPQPLVFLNGCRTTAVEPRAALEFVGVWIHAAHAAGIIGSDITAFESAASAFAEHCLAGFLGGQRLGDAVRRARLALLKQRVPLALTYVPFALACLRLANRNEGRGP